MWTLSVSIITYNEEKKIASCIESVASLADEIIVLDSLSTDKTKEIALNFPKVKFFQQPFIGHIEQKNAALDLCTQEYILSLDADEQLSPELQQSLRALKKTSPTHEGYILSRKSFWMGIAITTCGWYPDRKLRLIKKGSGRWQGVNPHDYLTLSSGFESSILRGDILHFTYDSLEDHVAQTNRFTTIAAKAHFAEGVRSNVFKCISRPILKFLKDFVVKRGFTQGMVGLQICVINALSAFLKYSKIYWLQKTATKKRQ